MGPVRKTSHLVGSRSKNSRIKYSILPNEQLSVTQVIRNNRKHRRNMIPSLIQYGSEAFINENEYQNPNLRPYNHEINKQDFMPNETSKDTTPDISSYS